MRSSSRVVRVFISSTFRDFIEERDLLVKQVFPELRRRCRERFVELIEVDLRWGITEEQSRSGETLKICLREIDRCRPSAPVFFLGLLGERYGWVPPRDHFTLDVLEDPDLGWVKQHVGGKSVTELEVLHGVLRNKRMKDKAFFYFRKDGYEKRHWNHIRQYHRGIKPPIKPFDFTNEKPDQLTTAAARSAQKRLKKMIRDASLKWDPSTYEKPADMAKRVLDHLWKAIDAAFPASSIPDELERQRMEHEAFARSRTRAYLPRKGLFEKLDAILKKDGPQLLVVTGESGSGKSALLAAWLEHAEKKLPARTFAHFIGATAESSSAESILFRLLRTLRGWGNESERMPDSLADAASKLPDWLARTAQKGTVLLVFDAINQIEAEHDRDLWWFPATLPEHVKVIFSTLPGTSEDALKARCRTQDVVKIPLLGTTEKRGIIQRYLERISRSVDAGLVDTIVAAPQSANPLFLRVLLDELRVRASHKDLPEKIAGLLESADLPDLFVKVLKNLEEYDRGRPDLVRESLGLLSVARRGLTETELLELLSSSKNPAREPLPRHYWSPLYLALEESLVSRNGRLSFFHDYLRQAVEREYLDEEQERQNVHRRFGEVAFAWNKKMFCSDLREYSLAWGGMHLQLAGWGTKIYDLIEDGSFPEMQQNMFGGFHESLSVLKHGIESCLSGNDADPRIDKKLFKMVGDHINFRERDLRVVPLANPDSNQACVTAYGNLSKRLDRLFGNASNAPFDESEKKELFLRAIRLFIQYLCDGGQSFPIEQSRSAAHLVLTHIRNFESKNSADKAGEEDDAFLLNPGDDISANTFFVDVLNDANEEGGVWMAGVMARYLPIDSVAELGKLVAPQLLCMIGNKRIARSAAGTFTDKFLVCDVQSPETLVRETILAHVGSHEFSLQEIDALKTLIARGWDQDRISGALVDEARAQSAPCKMSKYHGLALYLYCEANQLDKAGDVLSGMHKDYAAMPASILAEFIAGSNDPVERASRLAGSLQPLIFRHLCDRLARRLAFRERYRDSLATINLCADGGEHSLARMFSRIILVGEYGDLSRQLGIKINEVPLRCMALLGVALMICRNNLAEKVSVLCGVAEAEIRKFGKNIVSYAKIAEILALSGKIRWLSGDTEGATRCFEEAFRIFDSSSTSGFYIVESHVTVISIMAPGGLSDSDARLLAEVYDDVYRKLPLLGCQTVRNAVLDALRKTGRREAGIRLLDVTQKATKALAFPLDIRKWEEWRMEQGRILLHEVQGEELGFDRKALMDRFESAYFENLIPLEPAEAWRNLRESEDKLPAVYDVIASCIEKGDPQRGFHIADLCSGLGVCGLVASIAPR